MKLFKQGKTLGQIAEERNMTLGSIEGHLAYYVSRAEIDIRVLITSENEILIKNAIEKWGFVSTSILKQNLPDLISYNQIRLMVESIKPKT